jgi:hypothetical protein
MNFVWKGGKCSGEKKNCNWLREPGVQVPVVFSVGLFEK